MCLICVEFKKNKDIDDALNMIENAKQEPSDIDETHLELIEFQIRSVKTIKDAIDNGVKTPFVEEW